MEQKQKGGDHPDRSRSDPRRADTIAQRQQTRFIRIVFHRANAALSRSYQKGQHDA